MKNYGTNYPALASAFDSEMCRLEAMSRHLNCRCYYISANNGGFQVTVKAFDDLGHSVASIRMLCSDEVREGLALYGARGYARMIVDTLIDKATEEYKNAYCSEDWKEYRRLVLGLWEPYTAQQRADDYIKRVIFNPPATIVFFKDGQKVVVKCQEGDEWDIEKALAMAIVKHDHGLPVFNKIISRKSEFRYEKGEENE